MCIFRWLIQEKVYGEQPFSFEDLKKLDQACKLHQVLYGLSILLELGVKDYYMIMDSKEVIDWMLFIKSNDKEFLLPYEIH